ncbi:kinase-like domain-containing protein, partial [Mycena pura]
LAEGLAYLHSHGITHGNLCTKKVLIDKDGKPVICGYGLCPILGPVANTTSLFSFPIRFSAPEYFSDESGASSVRTTAGDVYAFSMVMLEIITGHEPYYTLPTEHAVFKHILRGQGPTRSDYWTIADRTWTLLTSLWDQSPCLRPAMSDVVISLVQMCAVI